MSQRLPLSSADKLTVGALVVVAVGVAIQIAAGAPYPTVCSPREAMYGADPR